MNELKIHFLNTIWSDAIILEKNKNYAFIDTGSKFYYPMIQDYLNSNEINEIEFILLTHFHNDHYGNVENIIKNYKVNKLYLKRYYGLDGTTSSGYSSNDEYIEIEFKNYYDILNACKECNTDIVFIDELGLDELVINLDSTVIEVYDIKNLLYELYSDENSEFYQKKQFNENFNCAGVFIKEKGHNIFLGADVTCSKTDIIPLKELSYKMMKKIYLKHNINHIDIYKSCHHGGGGTNTPLLCDLLKARYVVITNTARWLDTYDTFYNLKNAYSDVLILPTDYQKYIFSIDEEIKYEEIREDSLFITLKKD